MYVLTHERSLNTEFAKIFSPSQKLFDKINTKHEEGTGKTEKLDETEIKQAKTFGFGSLFELKENMTEAEFNEAYKNAVSTNFDEAH